MHQNQINYVIIKHVEKNLKIKFLQQDIFILGMTQKAQAIKQRSLLSSLFISI